MAATIWRSLLPQIAGDQCLVGQEMLTLRGAMPRESLPRRSL